MKKILVSIFLLYLFYPLWATPIDIETAKKVAKNFISQRRNTPNEVLNVVTEKMNGENSFYVVNFHEGGWVIVSSDNSTVPVLAYSIEGTYKLEDQKPEAFIEIIESYKEVIDVSKDNNQSYPQLIQKWDELINYTPLITLKNYAPNTKLLNVPVRGHIKWSQGLNNDAGCEPSYNKFAPLGIYECDCYKHTVGCGAVAMGQIMWYWQWPLSSNFRTYDWNLMPAELKNTSTIEEGNEVALLLIDCGIASNMVYGYETYCYGSWTTVNNIVDALKNNFNYKGAKKHVRSDWNYGNAWGDLLRSEIDNRRPVFYRGDKCDFCDEKHFFVLDGYDSLDPDFFWFNFGWGFPGNYYNISAHYLNNLAPGSHEYNKNQMAIVGISPSYLIPNNTNIVDLPYTSVTDYKFEAALQNIILPASGKSISVESGGELVFEAGNSIILKNGFHAKKDSKFSAKINPDYDQMKITVPSWTNTFSSNGLCFNVYNANSWEFEVFNVFPAGTPAFQSAGTIDGTSVCVWDGSGVPCMEAYPCIIRFKNNYGQTVEKAYMITFLCGSNSTEELDRIEVIDTIEMKNLHSSEEDSFNDLEFRVSPNPNSGFFEIVFLNDFVKNIKIFNTLGVPVYQELNSVNQIVNINLTNSSTGIYLIKVETEKQTITKKVILRK